MVDREREREVHERKHCRTMAGKKETQTERETEFNHTDDAHTKEEKYCIHPSHHHQYHVYSDV